MLTVEQAKAKILEGAEAVAEVEDMVTLYSAGKILAEDIVSEIKVPPLDNSQMDGYAVRCADFAGGRRNFPATSAPNLNPALSLASLPAPRVLRVPMQ